MRLGFEGRSFELLWQAQVIAIFGQDELGILVRKAASQLLGHFLDRFCLIFEDRARRF